MVRLVEIASASSVGLDLPSIAAMELAAAEQAYLAAVENSMVEIGKADTWVDGKVANKRVSWDRRASLEHRACSGLEPFQC